jgi:uncharacterized repeat protein (TIGR01451 family)
MTIAIARRVKHASLALIALSSVNGLQSAWAVGTDAGTDITNRATVTYSVAGAPQTLIESSPTGNVTPGLGSGANTTFEVDNKILHVVAELGGAATITSPGATNVIVRFTVTNQGNSSQGYQLLASNLTSGSVFGQADSTEVTIVRVFHDANANNVFDAGDTENFINTLGEDLAATVVVVASVPVTTSNGQYANVQLAATATAPGTNAATPILETGGLDNPAAVDVVWADGGAVARNGIHEADNQYAIQSAALSVTKTAEVVSDPINLTSDPKAIPGATIEYTIAVNNSGTQDATTVTLSDPIPANTTYVAGSITVNSASVADTGRTVGSPVTAISLDPGVIPAGGGSATVTFRVTINATP